MSIITLTTDFGTRDWFVGTLKGVILEIHPQARIVDLTHEIPSGDIRCGAFALAAACRSFPTGTLHLAVVDPGVGGPRSPLAIRTRRFIFIGPDNGLLSLALESESVREVRQLENRKFFLEPVSQTFHGRDVFAPVAAHLAAGAPFGRVGPLLPGLRKLAWAAPATQRRGIQGEVVYVDHYGNALTNIPGSSLPDTPGLQVRIPSTPVCPLQSFYAAVPRGKPVAVVGSTGFLEIAVNGGSAARQFHLRPGTKVLVQSRTSARTLGRRRGTPNVP
jgi:S-adenosylmethionine hydrolase